MRYKSLQNQVTAGRITLPVVILICAACWLLTSMLLPILPPEPGNYLLWQSFRKLELPPGALQGVSFILYASIGYFLIEINNTFAIIRMRASVQTSFYFLLITACPGLHQLYAGDVAAIAFLISLYFLLKSYQVPHPAPCLFHSFVFIGAGSVLFPQLTFFVPIWFIGACTFQSFTLRSFYGAIVGWMLPYWFLLGYAFFYEQMDLFYAPFLELATFQPIRILEDLPLWELATLGYIFILFIVSTIHCLATGYQDKKRTRSYLHFLIFLCFCLFIFIFLQPIHAINLLSLLLIVVSILLGHLFVLTNSRPANWFFIGSTVGLILLYSFNLWMLL